MYLYDLSSQELIDTHPSVRGGRAVGLFGCLDLQGPDGAYIQPVAGPVHPAVPAFKKALMEKSIYGFVRPPVMHCAPPRGRQTAHVAARVSIALTCSAMRRR